MESVNQNNKPTSTSFLPYSKIPSWVLFLKVSGNALGIYQYLYILNQQFNQVHPSLEKIYTARSIVRNTARKALKELEALGLIKIQSMRGKGHFASTYEILPLSISDIEKIIPAEFHYVLRELNSSFSEPVRNCTVESQTGQKLILEPVNNSPVQYSTGQKMTRIPVNNCPVNRSEIDPHNNVLINNYNDDEERACARGGSSPPSFVRREYKTAEQPKSEIRSLREENMDSSLVLVKPEIIDCRSKEREFNGKRTGISVRIQELLTTAQADGSFGKLKFFPNQFIMKSNFEKVLEAIEFKESKREKLDSSITHSIEKFEATINVILKRKAEETAKLLQKAKDAQNVRYVTFETETDADAKTEIFERERKANLFFSKYGGNNNSWKNL